MIAKLLENFRTENAQETAIVARLSQFAASYGEAVLGREIVGELGHVTSAAWILNCDATRVLLVFGAKENAWKLPGAHSEIQSAADLIQSARREATRALGRQAGENGGALFAICEHRIATYWNTPTHLHFELVFRFDETETNDSFAVLPRGARWFWLHEAAQLGCESIAFLVRKTGFNKELTFL